jgi:purine-binding chemotaxis protein CheW
VASDDQKVRPVGGQEASSLGERYPKHDALMAQAMSAALLGEQVNQFGPHAVDRGNRGTNQITALQSQLAQISQLRPDSSPAGAPPEAVAGEQYLVFSLLECECALKAEHIQGVERLVDVTPVPNVAPWVRGVINLRGSIASVVDLRSFLDMEQLPYNPRTRLLSVQYNEMVICLVVDGVSEMVPIPDTAITNILSTRQTIIPQWAIPYAYGSALLDKRAIVLLDAARLLFSDKMQRYEALE